MITNNSRIVTVTSPIYSAQNNSQIDVMATFDNGVTYPYTANAADTMSYGIQLWADLNAGKHGTIAAYVQAQPA